MNNLDLTKKFLMLLDEKDLQSAAKFLADDAQIIGPTTEITKDQFTSYLSALLSSFPDFRFNSSSLIEKDDGTVVCTTQETGTHQGDLDLNPFGISVSLPATGKTFSLPETTMDFTFRDGKIIMLKEAHVEGGGLKGILAQLGVDMP